MYEGRKNSVTTAVLPDRFKKSSSFIDMVYPYVRVKSEKRAKLQDAFEGPFALVSLNG